jgi:hypothetical protein
VTLLILGIVIGFVAYAFWHFLHDAREARRRSEDE